MPSKNPNTRQTIARIAAAKRWGNDSADLTEVHRDHAAERLAEYVQRVVATAPPLTDKQRDRISAILSGGAK